MTEEKDARVSIAKFLLARVTEDEAEARLPQQGWVDMSEGLPIGCWDEKRVLAECEAKRAIVAEHADIEADWEPLFGDLPEDRPPSRCQQCVSQTDAGYLALFPCRTLRLLSLPYADHPDYDEGWRQ